MGDSPPSLGVTKEIAVAVKESSRPVQKCVGQRKPAKRLSSSPPPREPTSPCLVTSKKIHSLYVHLMRVSLVLAKGTLLRITFEEQICLDSIEKFLSSP